MTYADDFVVLCHSRQEAETVRAKAEARLRERGLTLDQEKTAIRHIDDGSDFLSFNIRRYHPQDGGKPKILIKPSKDALIPVTGRNPPDDPDLAPYWADRRRRRTPPQLPRSRQTALRDQRGRCPLCGQPPLHEDEPPDTRHEWEQWFADLGTRLTYQPTPDLDSRRTKHRYVHAGCARRQDATRPAPHSPAE